MLPTTVSIEREVRSERIPEFSVCACPFAGRCQRGSKGQGWATDRTTGRGTCYRPRYWPPLPLASPVAIGKEKRREPEPEYGSDRDRISHRLGCNSSYQDEYRKENRHVPGE